jgi:hypothetical protein
MLYLESLIEEPYRCSSAVVFRLRSSWCGRWYRKYGISYRVLAEMILERGVEVGPSKIMHWVHRYAPELEKPGGIRITARSLGEETRHM